MMNKMQLQLQIIRMLCSSVAILAISYALQVILGEKRIGCARAQPKRHFQILIKANPDDLRSGYSSIPRVNDTLFKTFVHAMSVI